MKKTHIIAILMIIVAIVIFITAAEDVSAYASFADAKTKSSILKVAGTLSKEKPMDYDPENSPNEFSFFLIDADGATNQVVLSKPKPQDFEMAEQIVVTGQMQDEIFVANDVLTKCPSKYKEEELSLKSEI